MKTKKIIAIILVGVGILSAAAAETLATPLVVEQGSYSTFGAFCCGGIANRDEATFSGDSFAASGLFTHESNFFEEVFVTGVLNVGFGVLGGLGSGGTIQVADVSCQIGPPFAADCGAALRFIHPPLTIPPNLTNPFVGEAPFTLTGQLVLGRVGLPNLIVDIEGSGIVHGLSYNDSSPIVSPTWGPGGVYNARYDFAVPEPSMVVLVGSGLLAVGWSRRRGGKRPVSRVR